MSGLDTNDQLLELLLTLDLALFTKALEGQYTYMNAAGARMVGRRVDEIVGSDDHDIFERGTADVIRVRDLFIRDLREPFSYDCKSLLRGSEAPIPFHSIKSSIRDGSGRVTGLLAMSLITKAPAGVHQRMRALVRDLAETRVHALISICRRGSFPFAI